MNRLNKALLTILLSHTPFVSPAQEVEHKKEAVQDQTDLELAHAMVFGQALCKLLPPPLRKQIDEYAHCEELFTLSSVNEHCTFGKDSQGQPFLYYTCPNVEGTTSYRTQFSPLDHRHVFKPQSSNLAQSIFFGTQKSLGNGKMLCKENKILKIYNENGKEAEALDLKWTSDYCTVTAADNTLVYAMKTRFTMAQPQEPRGLELMQEIDGVKLFRTRTDKRRGFELASACDKEGNCWIASSDGELWNTKNPETSQKYPAKKIGRAGFLMTCDTAGKPHAVISSSSTPGEFNLVALPEGTTVQTFRQPTELSAVAMCGNNRIITGDNDGIIRIWSIGSNAQPITLTTHNQEPCKHVAAAHDGSYFACTSWDFMRKQTSPPTNAYAYITAWETTSPIQLALAQIAAGRQ